MRVYVDSSALIKRVVADRESAALVEALDTHHGGGDLLLSSSLAWIEVSRALRNRHHHRLARVTADVEAALSGVAEHPMAPEVVSLARRVNPDALRSLDAIHVASALLVDADLVIAYDVRLLAACEENGLATATPT
ncbi:type II toxin-antitoxin system VapC family toxin [Pseudonocardia sp. DLS-67]